MRTNTDTQQERSVKVNTYQGNLEDAIAFAIEQAHFFCEEKGNDTNECTVAWNIVTLLQTEAADYGGAQTN